MSKFACKLFLLGFLVLATLLLIAFAPVYHSSHYMAAANDKHRRLASFKPPRIVLVGGSNLAFSVDSEKIEKRFGVPVVNMALHANVGLKFMLDEVRPVLGAGDIVIILPEYEHFHFMPLNGRPLELGAVVKYCLECALSISGDQIPIAATGIFQSMSGDIFRMFTPEEVYFRQGFNQWGDVISHLDQPDHGALEGHVRPIRIVSPNPAVDALNSFYASCRAKDVRVFMLFPAIPLYEYNDQAQNFTALSDFLKSELNMPILGVPQDAVYIKRFFYDTVYHLNRAGRAKNTERIIELLAQAFQDMGQ